MKSSCDIILFPYFVDGCYCFCGIHNFLGFLQSPSRRSEILAKAMSLSKMSMEAMTRNSELGG